MPLFKYIRIDVTRKSFYICFEFIAREDRDNYIQSLELLKEILRLDIEPRVFLVDKAETIRGAIKEVFLEQIYLFYIQHTNKNISTNYKAYFKDEEQKDFIKDQIQIIYIPNIEAYKEAITIFKTYQ